MLEKQERPAGALTGKTRVFGPWSVRERARVVEMTRAMRRKLLIAVFVSLGRGEAWRLGV